MPVTAHARSLPAPSGPRYARNIHAPNPNNIRLDTVMKMTWKALSDITSMGCGERGEIVIRRNRNEHQTDEEKRRESEHGVNHLLLGDKVHEKQRHQRGLD